MEVGMARREGERKGGRRGYTKFSVDISPKNETSPLKSRLYR